MKRNLFFKILIVLVIFGLGISGGGVSKARAAGPVCYVDDTADGAGSGADWSNAFTNLQAALSDPGCTDIRVAAGLYTPSNVAGSAATFQLRSGVTIVGGYLDGGGETSDPKVNLSTLSGDIGVIGNYDDNSYHVVTGSGADASAVLDGFRIINGNAMAASPNDRGAGIYIESGSPTLRNLAISGNSVTAGGGGIYLFDASPIITDVSITGNGGPLGGSLYGGGLWNNAGSNPVLTRVSFSSNAGDDGGGMHSSSGSPTLTDVTFTSNSAGDRGGGLFINSGSTRLSNCRFDGNDAYRGAGIYLNGGGLHLQDSRLENGLAGGYGGGLYTTAGSDATIRESTFYKNTAFSQGGGLYVAGRIVMVGGSVSENTGEAGGGGMALDGSNSADFVNLMVSLNKTISGGFGGGILSTGSIVRFANLLLTRNDAWQSGGMMLQNSNVSILDATIAENTASHQGVAINSDGILFIANTIVWGHSDLYSSIISAASTAVRASNLEDGCPAGATCSPDVASADPQFVDPQVPDYRLSPTSQAVDAGDVSALPQDTFDLDGDGNLTEYISQDMRGKSRIAIGGVDMGAYERQAVNINWTQATTMSLDPVQPDVLSASNNRYLDRQGQSQWFKFTIKPGSKLVVTLTNLPANYDLTLYKDISQAYHELSSVQDLLKLSAEFAPDTFSPDTFSPDTFSPDTFSPDTFSPDTFSPDTFSPDTFSPDTFSPDTFSPDTFSPDTFSPDTFSPDTFSPDTFSPDLFSSAQTRSLIAVSAHEGTQGEGIIVNTWTKTGDFYVRVRGRNGAFYSDAPFQLQVTLLTGSCGSVSPVLQASNTSLPEGGYHTLILTNFGQTEGTLAEKDLLQTKLTDVVARTSGWVVDVGTDAKVSAAFTQAQSNRACVYAMNLQAEAIKSLVDDFRVKNPDLEYIVLVGNDHAIPFFRYSDNALLASEIDYSPPVLDDTTSQASLKSGYILSQDTYGSSGDISLKSGSFPIPDLPVGRLVETASDINHLLDAYLGTTDGTITPQNALVTGYDFLADAADAVKNELQTSLGTTHVDTLIEPNTVAPANSWTADELRQSFLGSRHDINFLAGHFSATSALAADYKTRLAASEVLASTSTDLTNSLVYSAGCHSGYNIVNADDVPNVTEEPDWAQVFAAKGATFIAGTGYQYGDTDFVEYSERLYLEFTKQLRYGTDPVPVGTALYQAKQAYLAATPLMRGIHEKTVLEATLFGLPMMKFDLPNRSTAPTDTSLVTGTSSYPDNPVNPGNILGLKFYNLHVEPTLPTLTTQRDHTVVLTESDGSTQNAFYLEGLNGVTVNPAEPVLPLDMLNVTSLDAGYVLRGVGWRGGRFTDLLNILPFTGAATEDLRAPHTAFFSDVFYPIRPWNVNYFDALGSSEGATRLALMPAQYRSSSPGSLTGILRRFDGMDFRLYYSGNISTYPTSGDSSNTPALSAPPDISRVYSSITGSQVSLEVTVTGDPATGIQEVWIVYLLEDGGTSGTWHPFDLEQDPADSRLWKGTLDLTGTPFTGMHFVVQAVNGVGLVTMMTNQGAYYQVGVDPAAVPQGLPAVVLTLESPAANGNYGSQQEFTALAKNDSDTSLPNLPITFSLGGQSRLAVTGSDGRATANFFLASQPGDYSLEAAFSGNDAYASANTSSPFTLGSGSSRVVLDPIQDVLSGSSAQISAIVTSSDVPLTGKPVALTLSLGDVIKFTGVAITDYSGQASWQVPGQNAGTYSVKGWFALPVSTDLDLSSAYYTGAFDTGSLVVEPRTGLAIQYNGDTYLAAGISSATLKAQLTGPSLCLNNQIVTFKQDANGDGIYESFLGTETTDSSGLASYRLDGLKAGAIYEFEVSVPEGNCNGVVNTGTLMVAGSGDSSNGGGYYNLSGAGRINFGYTLQVKSTKTGTTVTGQMLWHVQGKTRLKGTITAYNKACPSGTTAPLGTTCGYLTGTGSLYSWNSTTNSWTLTATNVGFQVTVADGGSIKSCLKKVCSIVLKPDFFRMNLPSAIVIGESTDLTQLKGGNIVVK